MRSAPVHFNGPIPRHRHLLTHQAQGPPIRLFDPEGGMHRLGKLSPAQPFFIPESIFCIATGINKRQEFGIRHQHSTGAEFRHLCVMHAVFIVPTIDAALACAGTGICMRITLPMVTAPAGTLTKAFFGTVAQSTGLAVTGNQLDCVAHSPDDAGESTPMRFRDESAHAQSPSESPTKGYPKTWDRTRRPQ